MGLVIKKKKKKINFVRDGCTAFQINEDFYKNILGPLSIKSLNFFFQLLRNLSGVGVCLEIF